MGGGTGTLFACAVPIGNLGDASPRLREVLAAVDAIACEDTRTTGRLLGLLGVDPRPRLLAHHGHNERASSDGIVALLCAGRDVALVSDAGTPSVSDPGAQLVRAAHEAGVRVVGVAGPSAVATAVAVAGATGDGFRFVGFLPRGSESLDALLERHAGEVVVGFESPRRMRATLERIEARQPERIVTCCRELTKLHEQVVRGTPGVVRAALDPDVRGECVLVLDAMLDEGGDAGSAEPLALARELVEAGLRTKDAARIAVRHLGGSTREVYERLH